MYARHVGLGRIGLMWRSKEFKVACFFLSTMLRIRSFGLGPALYDNYHVHLHLVTPRAATLINIPKDCTWRVMGT